MDDLGRKKPRVGPQLVVKHAAPGHAHEHELEEELHTREGEGAEHQGIPDLDPAEAVAAARIGHPGGRGVHPGDDGRGAGHTDGGCHG